MVDIKDISYVLDTGDELAEEGEDLKEEVRKTLGDFLSEKTKESRSEFKIRPGSENWKSKTQDGTPVNISTGDAGAENVFANPAEHPSLDQYSDSGQFEEGVSSFIFKGGEGHKALQEIRGNELDTTGQLQIKARGDEPPLVSKISQVLKTNRFHPEGKTPFVPRGTSSTEMDTIGLGRIQKDMGRYNADDVDIRFEDLRKVGLSLMLKATGEFTANGDPDGGIAGLSQITPGEAQLAATRLDPKSLYASNVFVGENFQKEDTLILETESVALKGSYGVLNNHLEPFAGFQPIGMSVLASALVLALKLVLEGFIALIGVFIDDSAENKVKGRGPFRLGVHGNRAESGGVFISLTDFGFYPVESPFLDAIDEGLDCFFDFENLDGSFKRVLESPGFYAILIRSIIRSGNKIAEDIADVADSGNVFEGIQGIIGILDTIRSSKIISFLNILAQIGDKVIQAKNAGIEVRADKFSLKDVDKLPDLPTTRIGKSRSKNSLALAWRNSSSPSSYIIPLSMFNLQKLMPNDKNKAINLFATSHINDVRFTNRISNEDVKKIEEKLDAEYVPFYFHDLRTNEIISFHAFLSAITDNFNANYENSSVYGRIDPVRIYKNTERTISLEFNVVSTNETDFNEMWWKINKLITLLYPQWSKGRKIKTETDAFIQPFSQIPTASPLIRLRLGDIFKTNYSKFALARLFGLGTKDFEIESEPIEDPDIQEKINELKTKDEKMLERMFPNKEESLLAGGLKEGEIVDLSDGEYPAKDGGAPLSIANKIPVEITKIQEQQEITNLLEKGMTAGGSWKTDIYEIKLLEPEKHKNGDKPYLARRSDLQFSYKNYLKRANELDDEIGGLEAEAEAEATLQGKLQSVKDFFDSEKNAIVRSFESVSGKGLAGFITNMNFNWHEPRWDTEIDHRAPQWCRISIGFAPIHDIPPGIDSEGFNRAPVYNVGNLVNSIGGGPYEEEDREEYNSQILKASETYSEGE